MNNSDINICPICKEKNNVNDEFCSNCSWELIDIPKDPKDALFEYFNKKVNNHKQLFKKIIAYQNTIKQINEENYELVKTVEKFEVLNKQLSKENKNLIKIINNKKNLEKELNSYVRRYGKNWISNNTQTNKEVLFVNWEIKNNKLILSSEDKNFIKSIPKQLVILFKQRSSPEFGNFEIAILGECKFNDNIITVQINISLIPKGTYFIKPISLISKDKNILLFHKEQSLNPNNFDWDKTKITIL